MPYNLRNHDEVAHFWANEIQESGRGCNVFFERKTIFSYGYHFAIAKHYDNDLILFTSRGYSSSTSKHICYVRRAIPSFKNILYCYDPENPSSPENLDAAIRDIEGNLRKAVKARSRKAEYLREAESTYNGLIILKTTFKIKGWKIPKYDFSIPENVLEVVAERERKATAKRKRNEAKQRKQDKLDMVEFLEDVEKWKSGVIASPYSVRHSRLIHSTDYCRINGDVVESMRSADIPLVEAKVALKMIEAGKPVKGLKLGHYRVVSYDKKTLVIGCHSFLQSEIEWLSSEINKG